MTGQVWQNASVSGAVCILCLHNSTHAVTDALRCNADNHSSLNPTIVGGC